MSNLDLLRVSLSLFDGEGGDGGTTASAGDTASATTTGDTVSNAAAAGQSEANVTSNTLEDKRKAYQDLIRGEYKDFFTEDTQRIVNRRFADYKTLKDSVDKSKPIMDLLSQRYGENDTDKLMKALENDNRYYEDAAEQAGMSVDQFREMQRLQRENAALHEAQTRAQSQQKANEQLQKWYGEAENLKSMYPNFDLGAEAQNKQFLDLLKAGIEMKVAYEVTHQDEIIKAREAAVAKATEKQVADSVKAKGARPAENGVSSQSGFTVKEDVSKLTAEQRLDLIKRAQMGEMISFGN